MDKKQLSERDICTKFITPAVQKAGWDIITQVREEVTRAQRAANVRKQDGFAKYGAKGRGVLEALLAKYEDEGVTALDDLRILKIAPFDAMGTPVELLTTFGGREGFESAVREMQAALYQQAS